MTLMEYGPEYEHFTIDELKAAMESRNIIRSYRDRRRMMSALRRADLKATFRFLDLPAELRDMVYGDVLTFRPSRWRNESNACHTSILATCKQVNAEGDGLLNDVNRVQVGLRMSGRGFRIPGSYPTETYFGLDVDIKGAKIFSAGPNITATKIKWPAFLRRARSLTLNLTLEPVTSSEVFVRGGRAGIQVNRALHQLYTFLSDECEATALNVKVSTPLFGLYSTLREVLSPICALAGKAQSATFTFARISHELETEIKGATASFRKLSALKDDVTAAVEFDAMVYSYTGPEFKRYQHLMFPECGSGMCVYAGSQTLQDDTAGIESALEEIAAEDFEGLSIRMADIVRQLKEKQA